MCRRHPRVHRRTTVRNGVNLAVAKGPRFDFADRHEGAPRWRWFRRALVTRGSDADAGSDSPRTRLARDAAPAAGGRRIGGKEPKTDAGFLTRGTNPMAGSTTPPWAPG